MKLTTKQLKQIIKEELFKVLKESRVKGDPFHYRFPVTTISSWEGDARPDDWTEQDEEQLQKWTYDSQSDVASACEMLSYDYYLLVPGTELADGSYEDPTITDEDGYPMGRTISKAKYDRKVKILRELARGKQCQWAYSKEEWEAGADIATAGDPAPKRDDQ